MLAFYGTLTNQVALRLSRIVGVHVWWVALGTEPVNPLDGLEGSREGCGGRLAGKRWLEVEGVADDSKARKPPLESRQLLAIFDCLPTAPAPETDANAGPVPPVFETTPRCKPLSLRQPLIIQPAPISEQRSWNEQ
ncbi:hypothetical protein M405DRAFT_847440, partial [Rhizopogon salebrosus TDB-379]